MFCQAHGLLRKLDKRVNHMAINHGPLDMTLDKNDDQQLETEEAMIDVATDRQATAGNICALNLVTCSNC
jgi:hypothetical protein